MKIKRLFWKIFASFWLVSLAIMLVTTYAILASVETEKFQIQYERTLRSISERVIEYFETENNESVLHPRTLRRFGNAMHNPANHRQIMQIRKNDNIIFSRDGFSESDTFEFDFISKNDHHYTVTALRLKPPHHLTRTIQRVNTFQFLIILFASTIMSFLLSWSITRPLKKLGNASRHFANGALETQVDAHLLKRSDEIGELAHDFDFMMHQIRQTLNAQQQLLHDVSHELRAPLARLQVAAELIQQRDEKSQVYIQRIHDECDRMDQLIQRILNFSRMEEAAKFTMIDVAEWAQTHIDNVQFEYPQRHFEFHNQVNNSVRAIDPDLLGEALDNVLRNACKYTPDETPIHITLAYDKNRFSISIRDFGAGVPADEIPHLTTPFFRSGNRMHGEGFGLGLSIVSRAVTKHGGELRVENHPEGGLLVTLFLNEK